MKSVLNFWVFFLIVNNAFTATFTATTSGNWNIGTTWGGACTSGCVEGIDFPGAGDNVDIWGDPAIIVTLNVSDGACSNLTVGRNLFGSGFEGGSLVFLNATSQLTSSGTTFFEPTGSIDMANGGTFISGTWNWLLGGGSFNCGTGKVVFTGTFTLPSVINSTSINTYYDLEIDGGAEVTLGRTTSVGRHLTIEGILNASNKTLNIAGNFNVAGLFNAGTGTVVFNGTGNQTVDGTGLTFYKLTSNTTGPLVFSDPFSTPVTIQNTLTMTNGLLNITSVGTLILGISGTASTLTRTASITTNWIYGGTFQRFWIANTTISSTDAASYGLFPMGTSAASSYRPVEINSTASPTGNGNFTVNHIGVSDATDLSSPYNDGGSNITQINNSQFITSISGIADGAYNINVTMTGLQATGNISDIRLAVYTGAATASAVGTHAAASGTSSANPTAKRTGLTFANLNNDFRIATTNSAVTPLPIALLYFNAVLNREEVVDLTWITSTEINNDYFTIERSTNGVNFEVLTKIDGAGTSTIPLNYQTTDVHPHDGISYYRLKETDFDGKSRYSKLVAIKKANTDCLSFHPYFFDKKIVIQQHLCVSDNENVTVNIYDLTGRSYFSNTIATQPDTDFITIDLDKRLTSGIYMIVLSSSKVYSQKVVVNNR